MFNLFIIFQASCLAPFLLNPTIGSTILDMCSAPGMKCMQLAAMIEKTGKVYAIERDQRRFETLKKLLTTVDATNVETINRDVLTLTANELKNVEYILVDPSCSGSGMLDRIDFEDESSKCNESRLQKLAGFQITILRHALNNFKTAKRVVYSTCSLFPQENEDVVRQAITTTPEFKLVALNETMKNRWYNFGASGDEIGEKCMYALPETDHTNGFFIAVFDRLQEGETNEHFIKRIQRTSECESIPTENQENYTKSKKKRKRNNSENSRISKINEVTSDICNYTKKNKNNTQENEEKVSGNSRILKKNNKKRMERSEETEKSEELINLDLNGAKHKKKMKKRHEESSEEAKNNWSENLEDVRSEKKKKCFEDSNESIKNNITEDLEEIQSVKKKKKKSKHKEDIDDEINNLKNDCIEEEEKTLKIKKKKKKSISEENNLMLHLEDCIKNVEETSTEKKMKKKSSSEDNNFLTQFEETSVLKKKDKKLLLEDNIHSEKDSNEVVVELKTRKKKKPQEEDASRILIEKKKKKKLKLEESF